MVAHVLSWPPVRLRQARGSVGRSRCLEEDVLLHDQTSGAFFARAVLVYLLGRGGAAFPRVAYNFCALLHSSLGAFGMEYMVVLLTRFILLSGNRVVEFLTRNPIRFLLTPLFPIKEASAW